MRDRSLRAAGAVMGVSRAWRHRTVATARPALPRRIGPRAAVAALVALVALGSGWASGARAATTIATLAVGSGAGSSDVALYDGAASPPQPTGPHVAAFAPFTGGARVALGDVNGDGLPDLVAGNASNDASLVKILSGDPGAGQIQSYSAFGSVFMDGVYVATGDVDGDGLADVIVGSGAGGGAAGGPRVSVFRNSTTTPLLQDFLVFDPAFRGGVRVAAGDVNGDGRADLIVGAGPGGGPQVRVLDGATRQVIADFFAFEEEDRSGVFVAAGDVDGDGLADAIVGGDAGGAGPRVRVVSATDLAARQRVRTLTPFEQSFTGGVRVAAGDVDGDGRADVIVGAGPGGGPRVRVFDGRDLGQIRAFQPLDPDRTSGVWVSGAVPTRADRLAFEAGPGDGRPGRPLSKQPVIRVVDAAGNVVPTFTGQVTLSLTGGTAGASLGGTLTVAAVRGKATFSNVAVSALGVDYRLVAASAGLADGKSDEFDVVAPAATRLEFLTQPGGAPAGQPLAPQPSVRVLDQDDLPFTGFSGPVSLALGANPSGASLAGPRTVAATNGVATFSGLSVDRVGAGYTLVASASGLAGATSAPFSVAPAPTITCAPRANVGVQAVPDGAGRLRVTVRAPTGPGNEDNRLRSIRVGAATNAAVDVAPFGPPGGGATRPGLAGATGNTTLALTERPTELVLTVRRQRAGEATTVPLIVEDACGEWRTFVGGGPRAF